MVHHQAHAARREGSCTLSMVGLVYLTIAGAVNLLIDIVPNVPNASTTQNTIPTAAHPQHTLKNKLAVVTRKLNHSENPIVKKEVNSQQRNAVLIARKKAKEQRQLPQPACKTYQQASNSLGYEDCMQGYKEACKILQKESLIFPNPPGKDWHAGLQESLYYLRTVDNTAKSRHAQNCKILRSAS